MANFIHNKSTVKPLPNPKPHSNKDVTLLLTTNAANQINCDTSFKQIGDANVHLP